MPFITPIGNDIPKVSGAMLIVAGAAALLPYSGILDPYLSFLPEVLVPPIEAALGALLSVTAMDYVGTSFDKKWKERFTLSAFVGALAASMLAGPILGGESTVVTSLAAGAAVAGSFFSPYHLV